jgi:glutathione peroxidase
MLFTKLRVNIQNYSQLPKLVDQYGNRGFRVLAFPCNQFGDREPGNHDEIIDFVKKFDENMLEKLIFFEKGDVNGANTREVYSFLKREAPNEEGGIDVDWNFGEIAGTSRV